MYKKFILGKTRSLLYRKYLKGNTDLTDRRKGFYPLSAQEYKSFRNKWGNKNDLKILQAKMIDWCNFCNKKTELHLVT